MECAKVLDVEPIGVWKGSKNVKGCAQGGGTERVVFRLYNIAGNRSTSGCYNRSKSH